MPKCEQCSREFGSEEGYAQHMRDKHGIGRQSSHEMKEHKRLEREKGRETEAKKQKSGKKMKQIVFAGIIILAVIGISYALLQLGPATGNTARYDLTGFPNSFVHWHADVDVNICGEDRRLPEAGPGGMIGNPRLHTHDYAQNIASLPGTDGNGIIHTEGVIPQAPAEHTISKFMSNIGVRFSNTTIMEKSNGDLCGNTTGTVKIFLNDQPLENLNYLPRDKDVIRIEFN